MFNEHDRQESSEANELPAELKALERHLGEQRLALPRIDRDRLMFAAGEAFATRALAPLPLPAASWARSRVWPVATATMTAATVALALTLAWPTNESQVVETQAPTIARHDAAAQSPSAHDLAVSESQPEHEPIVVPPGELGDPWRLGGGGFLTARGMVTPPSAGVFAGDTHDFDTMPRKAATARDLLEELLPESERRLQHNS